MPHLWIDTEDLFRHAAVSDQPSGVQRLSLEIERALMARWGDAGAVRFVRLDATGRHFGEVPWADIAALFPAQAPRGGGHFLRLEAEGVHGESRLRRLAERLSWVVPLRLRAALLPAARLQILALRELRRGLGRIFSAPRRERRFAAGNAARFAAGAAPGDVLLTLGASWGQEGYAELIRQTCARHGLRYGLLVYDLIPALHPEWVEPRQGRRFTAWIEGVLPQAEILLSISHASARETRAYAARRGIALRSEIQVLPIGTGFAPPPPAPIPLELPAPGSYVLFVSTIEARKNHLLLFRAWQRLLAELPAETVPRLIFAGHPGPLTADLMQQIHNTAGLGGHLAIIVSPSDAELAALYRGCLFTVFPSLGEGWGLPVTESLAFGKPCLAARTSSLPEAGGDLARYFDPDDLHDTIRALRAAFEDRAGLAAWEARIGAEFRPVSWGESAASLAAACGLEVTTQTPPPSSPRMSIPHK